MLGRVAWLVRTIIRHIRLDIVIEVAIEVDDFIRALGLDGVWKLHLFRPLSFLTDFRGS